MFQSSPALMDGRNILGVQPGDTREVEFHSSPALMDGRNSSRRRSRSGAMTGFNPRPP